MLTICSAVLFRSTLISKNKRRSTFQKSIKIMLQRCCIVCKVKTVFIFIIVLMCLLISLYYVRWKNADMYLFKFHTLISPSSSYGDIILHTNSIFRWCSNKSLSSSIELDCQRLFDEHDELALRNATQWISPCSFSDDEAMKMTANCKNLKNEFPFWNEFYRSPIINAEEEYHLAFVLIGAKSAEQIIRLLQSIYHPKNIYCLTYDNKASHEFKRTMHNLCDCYDNIVMPQKFVNIYWAGFSILQTAMFCLETLTKQSIKWKYVQILSWNDFPLRTNKELVKIMQIFNGSQDSLLLSSSPHRTRQYFDVKYYSGIMNDHKDPKKLNITKTNPPGNLIEFKGSLATTMSRNFVEFLFTNSVAKKFYDWISSTYCPEETYWSTLIHNLHINPPGGFPGACYANYEVVKPEAPYMSRYQLWYGDERCKGKMQTYSCVFGVGDLFHLKIRPEFMAHKLYLDYQPALYYCLAQLHFNRTFYPEQYSPLNEQFYKNLPPVRYHRTKDKEKFTC